MPKFYANTNLNLALDALYTHDLILVEDCETYLTELLERACRPGEDPDTWGEYDKAVFKVKFLRA